MEAAVGGATAPASAGSATIVRVEEPETRSEVYVMRLEPRPHVTFDEETAVDNEFFGRKKSKRCCIFHKKRAFGESSSESEPDSDDSSSSAERRRTSRRQKAERKMHPGPKKHMCNDPSCTQSTQ
ncbi:unnamed protein product [Aphanomyces euteiches]|uniref:Protein phosphatase 1 regulatory subunit 11 n=1 Tax=Aphanomyces euteiches TaxID=100861 RepID=A0A6G0X5Y2_9STRA|nr:hypothetical protein Ae201684_008241 [Aphanomyces euteiches]KAH9070134.1 hypothetical protein Ae201684P_002504 [Aphanomyces euteiches]KAH9111592.1 hypothetical protein AeMF1_013913 [Aphanomyces euteiches]KAH9135297.1 hypothetical protein AeRB84_019228 [Aphanomyces euteiches]KAH9160361.1 hypothetical protein LEN26_001893 [Aphanomyces euteiches]